MPSARVVGEGQPKLPCPVILAYEVFCFPTSHLGLRGNGPLRPGSECGDRTGDRETTRQAAPPVGQGQAAKKDGGTSQWEGL